MEQNYYIGRATEADYDELMFVMNDAFGFDTDGKGGFIHILPKLYKKEYAPWSNNIIARVEGKIKAAIGLYYNELCVGAKTLKIGGIGNVAVDKNSRGGGYMKSTMAASLADMKKEKADLSFLGGRRQRYMYFSYDKGGLTYTFTINETSLRHTLSSAESNLRAIPIEANDTEALEEIFALYTKQNCAMKREKNALFDTLKSWKALPYKVCEDGKFAGYFVINDSKNYVYEMYAKDAKNYKQIAALALAESNKGEHSEEKGIGLTVPHFRRDLANALLEICESYELNHSEHFSILNYKNVIEAFLTLKAEYTNLPDGVFTMLIHGEAGDENLKISVSGSKIGVAPTDEKAEIELSHLEAVRFISSMFSERRDEIPAHAAAWFPLPLYISGVDGV